MGTVISQVERVPDRPFNVGNPRLSNGFGAGAGGVTDIR
jgi:hypothetical protein